MEKVSFVGAGSMAEAVIAGIVHKKVLNSEQVYVINKENKERLAFLHEEYGVTGSTDREEVIQGADIIVIATKPHDVDVALKDIASFVTSEQLIISVVAGVSTDAIAKSLGKNVPIIRTMPNTSATIGYSATAICKGEFATKKHIAQANEIFEAIGTVSIVDEKQMHIVTGISGSGPAYIYYLVEAMEEAAIEAGFEKDIAYELIVQVIKGASEMLKRSKKSARELREDITSPQGTTEAGLKMLKKYHFQEAIRSCVAAARKRSIELGKNF